MKKETILLFSVIIILINLVLVLSTNPLEDIFSSRFDTGVVGFVISMIPLAFLLILTYISFRKANRTLMSIQLLAWYIFTFYMCLRALAYLDPYLNLGFMPKDLINFFLTDNIPTGESEKYWFQLSIFVNAGVGLFFSLANKSFRNFFIKK